MKEKTDEKRTKNKRAKWIEMILPLIFTINMIEKQSQLKLLQ